MKRALFIVTMLPILAAGCDDGAQTAGDASVDAALPDAGVSVDAGLDAGPGCAVDCDCPQGMLCSGGNCYSGVQPVYCCDKPACPLGVSCTDQVGDPGVCPDGGP